MIKSGPEIASVLLHAANLPEQFALIVSRHLMPGTTLQERLETLETDVFAGRREYGSTGGGSGRTIRFPDIRVVCTAKRGGKENTLAREVRFFRVGN